MGPVTVPKLDPIGYAATVSDGGIDAPSVNERDRPALKFKPYCDRVWKSVHRGMTFAAGGGPRKWGWQTWGEYPVYGVYEVCSSLREAALRMCQRRSDNCNMVRVGV